MEIKNATYSSQDNKSVDVEILHPLFGWIPYTFTYNTDDVSFDAEIREYLETASINKFETVAKTSEQILTEEIAEAKAYLASTDYIVTKIAEAQALGEDTTSLLSKYAIELQQRKEARAFIGANS